MTDVTRDDVLNGVNDALTAVRIKGHNVSSEAAPRIRQHVLSEMQRHGVWTSHNMNLIIERALDAEGMPT